MRPDRLAKLGLDAWARPLPSPGSMIFVNIPAGRKGPGLYVQHLPSGHDRRVRHGHVLIGGDLIALDLNYVDPLPSE
jgi:hypothetical protein